MAESGVKVQYDFNGFRLDLRQRLLLSGADRRPVPLTSKVFDTLLYFVERRGELLDKATLMKAIWPNVVVEENNLNQNISALRRALGENPGEHRFIVTEPGRGYRFVADVRAVTVSASASSKERETPRSATAPAPHASSTARSSIAVLPFANLTGDPGKEYLGDGMAEELILTLARLPGLKIPARTSSFAYKGRNIDVRQIARDLEVGAVLEGSLRSAGERIRVSAQLVDGETGYHIWSQNYDRRFEDLFQLQEELAREIVQTLKLALDGRALGAGVHRPPTQDLEAYDLYLQAMAVAGTSEQSIRRSAEMLQRAIARDPRFARAYHGLVERRALALAIDVPLPGALADGEKEALQALALDPSLGAAHAALGIMYAAQGRWIDAEQQFQLAFACDETDPYVCQSYGQQLVGSAGFSRRYRELSLQAHRLAPAWIQNLVNLTVAHLLLAQDDQARKFLDLAFDLGLSRVVGGAPDLLAWLALRAGHYDEAARAFVAALSPAMREAGAVPAVERVFDALANPAQRAAAVETLSRLRATVAVQDLTQLTRRRFIVWYTLLGSLAEAFEVAHESLDTFARHGTIGTTWSLIWMPELLPFRQDARFQAFVSRLHLFEYWNQYGTPDGCELRDGKLICH